MQYFSLNTLQSSHAAQCMRLDGCELYQCLSFNLTQLEIGLHSAAQCEERLLGVL